MTKTIFDLTKHLPSASIALFQHVQEEASYLECPLYIVGGFVRDIILNLPSTDYDFVVKGNAINLANRLVEKYGGHLTTHQDFFTAKWFPQDPNLPEHIDLISARKEIYLQPAQLPSVALSDITDDLHRRDFTINTLALELKDLKKSSLIDSFNGLEDIQNKSLRTLHDKSFIDDPTRIFRIIRFEQRLQFKIQSSTKILIQDAVSNINLLTGKRIQHEFNLYNKEQTPEKYYQRIAKLNIFPIIHSALEFTTQKHQAIKSLFNNNPIDSTEKENNYIVSTILLSSNTQSEVEEISNRLMLSPAIPKAVMQTQQIININWNEFQPPIEITDLFDKMQKIAILAAFHLTSNKKLKSHIESYFGIWKKIHPIVTGDDLQQLNIPPSPIYKKIFKLIRAQKLDGHLATKLEELEYIKKHYL